MKKSLQALIILICAKQRVALAQGTVAFLNNSNSLVTTVDAITGIGAPVTPSEGVYIQLFYQPDTGQPAPYPINLYQQGIWEAINPAGPVGNPVPGRFGAFVLTTGTDVAPQGNVWLVALAWNGGATTYSQALGTATAFAISQEWSQATGGGMVAPVATDGFTGLLLITNFPEPSVTALIGLGTVSLLLFRRR